MNLRMLMMTLAGFVLAVAACSQQVAQAQDLSPATTLRVLLRDSPGLDARQSAVEVVQQWQAYSSGAETHPPSLLAGLQRNASVGFLFPHLAYSERQFDPKSAWGMLQRYIAISVPSPGRLGSVAALLRGSPAVLYLEERHDFSASPNDPYLGSPWDFEDAAEHQWGFHSLAIRDAWDWSWGHALIGVADAGVEKTHPDLRGLNSIGQYAGGNVLDSLSVDWGETVIDNAFQIVLLDSNVLTTEPVAPRGGVLGKFGNNCSAVTTPTFGGHGTHVAGIIAANTGNGVGVAGICPGCRLVWNKVDYLVCPTVGPLFSTVSSWALSQAHHTMIATGVQVVNYSLAGGGEDDCSAASYASDCALFEIMDSREVVLVAASGNARLSVGFPARDERVVAVGGYRSDLTFWDDFPNCPTQGVSITPTNPTPECGSNFTTAAHPGWRQELVAPAVDVLSTFDSNLSWNALGCSDDLTGTTYDDEVGYGFCKGTSMSAPHITGLFGLLRSLNPLLPSGRPSGPNNSLRKIVASTTHEAQSGQGWDPKFGYGRPDAYAATRLIMGRIDGQVPANRPIPLFAAKSNLATDLVYSTSPQTMVALANTIDPDLQYDVAVGQPVPGYGSFPHHADDFALPPRAVAYLLAGVGRFAATDPQPVPLQRLRKAFGPADRDYTYATDHTDINSLLAAGYTLEKIEGYVFGPCLTPGDTSCAPPGTEALYRVYNSSLTDGALALASELATFAAEGYGGPILLGFAYATTDGEFGSGDGLPDGFELAVGLSPFLSDSDADGELDGAEWPLAGISMSDPLKSDLPAIDVEVTSPGLAAANKSAVAVATNLTVRISVASSSTFSASISGPGNCVKQTSPKAEETIGSAFTWHCTVASLGAAQLSAWSVSVAGCYGSVNGTTSISIISMDQTDADTTNDYDSYYGDLCGGGNEV